MECLYTVAGAFFCGGGCAGGEGGCSGCAEHGGSDEEDVDEVHDCDVRGDCLDGKKAKYYVGGGMVCLPTWELARCLYISYPPSSYP